MAFIYKMKQIYFTIAIAALLFSCGNHTTPPPAVPQNADTTVTDKPTTSYFPVTSFLKGQMIGVDSVAFTPILYTTVNGKTDTTWLKREETKTFLQPFFSFNIDSTNLLSLFTETKFNDRTLNAITLTYDATGKLPDTVQLRNWTVYIDPESQKVRSLYIVKEYKENNQSYIQQLTWTTDRSAKITTILNQPDGNTQLLKEQKIVWTDIDDE